MSDTLPVIENKVGLFHTCYEIGNGLLGGVSFNVDLLVSTPSKMVSGFGSVTQTTNPPLDISTKLEGSYTYITVMPDTTHILVTLVGYPIVNWPPFGGIGPVLVPNVKLQMVLQEDWKSGTATLEYSDASGTWYTVANVPVRSRDCLPLPQ